MTLALDQLPDDVALLKQLIVEREQLFIEREAVIAQIKEEAARQLAAQAERHAAELKAAIQAILRRYYGPRSEKFDPRQLLLFGQVVDQLPLDEAGIAEEAGQPLVTRRVRNRDQHGRQQLPQELERIEIPHDLDDRRCPACGSERCRIGAEVSEQLEYFPASFKVLRHIRHKYACTRCDADGYTPNVATAAKPPQPIERGLPGPSLLAYVVTSKLADHRVQGEAVSKMRVGLSWPGDRTRPQTSPNCGGQEPSWEASDVKGAARPRQVRFAKSNASEPLMTCRNPADDVKTGVWWLPQDQHGKSLYLAHAASGTKAARARIRLGYGTLEPVVSMAREKPKRSSRKGESTDARHRGGTTCSSVEARVMRVERRSRVISSSFNRPTALAGGARG